MITSVSIALLAALTLYYIFFVGRTLVGLRRLSVTESDVNQTPFVSVIVAARNEENKIGACVQSILAQRYPSNQFELIVVNDGSTDETYTVVNKTTQGAGNIRVLTLPQDSGQHTGKKPAAIAAGVESAQGEIILTTDADCEVPHDWIAGMIRYFTPDVAFVAGPVLEYPGKALLSQIDQLELLGLISVAAGFIGIDRPIICNGANLGFRRTAFHAAQGHGPSETWCDDETLMQRIRRRKLGKVVFAARTDVIVRTESVNSVKAFLQQRLRWSSKSGHYEDHSILISLVALYFFFLFFMTMFAFSIFTPQLRGYVLLAWMSKVGVDLLVLFSGARLLHERIALFTFLVAEIFHVPYIVITAAIGQFASFEWKGRKVSL